MTLKLRMDLSVVFCGKSFQIDWKATFRSEIFYGMTGTSGKNQAQHPRHGSLGKLSPVKFGAICAYWWTRDNLAKRWSLQKAVLQSVTRLVCKWSAANPLYHETIAGYHKKTVKFENGILDFEILQMCLFYRYKNIILWIYMLISSKLILWNWCQNIQK